MEYLVFETTRVADYSELSFRSPCASRRDEISSFRGLMVTEIFEAQRRVLGLPRIYVGVYRHIANSMRECGGMPLERRYFA